MRLGVLDVGSNTVHLLVVDAYRGAEPTPQLSRKSVLRLAEHIDKRGDLALEGADALVGAALGARRQAAELGCDEVIAFATSAVRDARNSAEVLDRVSVEAGVELLVLPGDDEARLTFLAVRRWFGWSAGNLLCVDIGGGSLELGVGADEDPKFIVSLPLGAGRLTRQWLPEGQGTPDAVGDLRKRVRAEIAGDAGAVLRAGAPDRAVGTSKTLRSLARICGAAPSADGLLVRRVLRRDDLVAAIPDLTAMSPEGLAALPGVSWSRAHQLVAGAVVAEAVMDLFEISELEICPWALREGIILERLDRISIVGGRAESAG
jgi:exopolyphosphatase / guanosine-5'-triphosphate,3'-diphosphate pyrophosphatase